MPKFKKLPVEVEAERYHDSAWGIVMMRKFVGTRKDGTTNADGSEHVIQNFNPIGTYSQSDDPSVVAEVWDELHSTWVGVKHGQWIMKGAMGEFYPCVDNGEGTAPLNYEYVSD